MDRTAEYDASYRTRSAALAAGLQAASRSGLPAGLTIAAIPEREEPRDALIGCSLAELKEGTRIGTSSLRRSSQLLAFNPHLSIEMLRGNVDTRLRKLDEGQYDAIVLAAAGLRRLGWQDRIRELIPVEIMCPAVGQGALAIETRDDGGGGLDAGDRSPAETGCGRCDQAPPYQAPSCQDSPCQDPPCQAPPYHAPSHSHLARLWAVAHRVAQEQNHRNREREQDCADAERVVVGEDDRVDVDLLRQLRQRRGSVGCVA